MGKIEKAKKIFFNALPVLLMIGFIPLISEDYILAAIFVVIIIISLFIHKTENDITVMSFGFILMIIFESIFVSTGVETFTRNSLFGMMPVWLPFLWSYGFVAIKRSAVILSI